MSARWGLLGVLGILIVNASAFAQEVIERQVKAQSGRDSRIAAFVTIRQDCSAGPLPGVRLKEAPKNGTVTVKQGRIRTTNFRQCLAIEVPAFIAFYRSADGFAGEDSVLLEVVGANGKTQLQRFNVTVEKPAVGRAIAL